MDRPVVVIEKQPVDQAMEVSALLIWLGITAYTLFMFSSLPDSIPQHFGADGLPDRYGSKWSLLMLPVVGLVLGGGLYLLNRIPHKFNYLVEITAENAPRQYRQAQRLIRFLNTTIQVLFAYITWSTVQIGTGSATALGGWFLPTFLIGMHGIILVYLIRSGTTS